MNCPKCGGEINEGTRFCVHCGTNIEEYSQPAQNSNEYNGPKFVIPADHKPISAWGYVGYMWLMSIPVVGLILMCVYAFGGTQNINLKNFSRAIFINVLIGIALYLVIMFFIMAIAIGISASL